MHLSVFLVGFPLGAVRKWENDVGTFEEKQWEEVLQAVQMSSLNVAHCLSQLYIVLWVHYTPARLFRMGVRSDFDCPRYARDHGDLIHIIWHCLKLHLYWTGVLI